MDCLIGIGALATKRTMSFGQNSPDAAGRLVRCWNRGVAAGATTMDTAYSCCPQRHAFFPMNGVPLTDSPTDRYADLEADLKHEKASPRRAGGVCTSSAVFWGGGLRNRRMLD